MTEDEIQLSRRAGRVAMLVDFSQRTPFIDAVRQASSIESVIEPFRTWLLDPTAIPVERRTKVLDPKRHVLIDRPDSAMRID